MVTAIAGAVRTGLKRATVWRVSPGNWGRASNPVVHVTFGTRAAGIRWHDARRFIDAATRGHGTSCSPPQDRWSDTMQAPEHRRPYSKHPGGIPVSIDRLCLMPRALVAVAVASLAAAGAAHATENSQVRALLGAPSYEISTPQFPGLYAQFWYQHYEADKLRDADGKTPTQALTIPGVGTLPLTVNGSIKADVFVPRLTWVTEKIVMDGRLGFSAAFPLVRQTNDFTLTTVLPAGVPANVAAAVNQQLAAAGGALSGKRSGMADPELAAYLDWQQDESRVALGVAFNPPMGSYDADRPVNPGAGKYWTFKPLLVASRVWENGFAVGLRATYSFNTRNDDTGVRSGQYLHADWSGTYQLNDQWKFGVQGYVLKQFTADRGGDAGANKVQALSAGPLIAYLAESGDWGVDFKVMKEFSVRNRPEGTVTWLRLNYRLN